MIRTGSQELPEQNFCQICRGPWHPSTGMRIGTPTSWRACWACAKDSLRCLQWATGRRPKRGKIDFYKHAGTPK